MRQAVAGFLSVLFALGSQAQQDSPLASSPSFSQRKFVLEDATPVRLRLSENLSSADAKTGQTIDFEVLDEIKVDDIIVIPKGSLAWGTVTEAEHKKRMARGGKLDVAIDNVRLVDGEKAALRGAKDAAGGGHTGAMTAGIVATALIVWPSAPFFLFMHGKDITIPKGTEITAYINGNFPLDKQKFLQATKSSAPQDTAPTTATSTVLTTLAISSNPAGADIELDGSFVGDTPSSVESPRATTTSRSKRVAMSYGKRELRFRLES
jgi:hypothetical protein